jgi:mannan endo-1,6-alpha-mannosidase
MFSFKAYLLRWLASTIIVAPYTRELILPKLRASGIAAAKQCTGGDTGRKCGLQWTSGKWDGTNGVGQEMAAMSALYVNLLPLEEVKPPVTNSTGGTSQGNPNAGADSIHELEEFREVKMKDKAGAGMLTAVVIIGFTGMLGWMSF